MVEPLSKSRALPEFGRYRTVRRLAVGGMAEVYLAREIGIEGLERTVVIKRIRPEHREDDEFVTMFLDEARLLASLSHPNIAQVFDLGRVGDTYYLVMEYVRGPTLRMLLNASTNKKQVGLPEKQAIGIALGVAEGLAYVHSRRDDFGRPLAIVHRDLNPSNVIVSWDGAVKLIDFGIAKAATKVYETTTGVVKGTCGYMSPEQLAGAEHLDHRADLFALGVMLYEMCLGVHPSDVEPESGEASTEPVGVGADPKYQRMLEAKYVSPRTVRPEFPELLDRLIASCLAPKPEQRPPDVRSLIKTLTTHLVMRGVMPTMSDLAGFVEGLIPDQEGAPAVRPLTQLEPQPELD